MIIVEIAVVILIGLIGGSFSSALIHRVPLKLNWVSERSACPNCYHNLGILDLFPVFSWIFSGGKCRYCSAGISARYPLLECFSAAACLGIYASFGFSVESLICVASVPFLISLLMIDLEHFILPNQLVLAVFILGAIRLGYATIYGVHALPYIIGAVSFALLSWLIGFCMEKVLNKEALGFGDVKLFFVAGLWLGIEVLPYFLMGAGVFGVVFALVWQKIKKTAIFPFGPALIASFYILLLYQGSIMVL